MIEPSTHVPWAWATDQALAERMGDGAAPTWTAELLRIKWTCPRCEGEQHCEVQRDQGTAALDAGWLSKRLGWDDEEPTIRWERVTLVCACQAADHEHPGRPAEREDGCGFFADLEVPVPPPST